MSTPLRWLTAAWALSATATLASAASTITVPGDYPTITQAIGFAQVGDTVLVSPGVYFEQVDFGGKDITVLSTDGPETTILDGQGQYTVVVFATGEGPNARLDGFTVRNGQGSLASDGGGIWCRRADPTIVNCTVTGNQGVSPGGHGGPGGISVEEGSPTIEGCVVEFNVGGGGADAGAGPGGIGVLRSGILGTGDGTIIRDCQIRSNRGGDGSGCNTQGGAGGVGCHFAIVTIEDCTVSENEGGGIVGAGCGGVAGVGGIFSNSSAVQVRRCRVLSNLGGGDRTADGGNDGGTGGLAFRVRLPTAPTLPQSLVNTVVAWNLGGDGGASSGSDGGVGGVDLFAGVWMDVTNCAVVGNVGGVGDTSGSDGSVGGMSVTGLDPIIPIMTISNTIFWVNEGQAGANDNLYTPGPNPPIRSHLLFNSDPKFVDMANNDFHLTCRSPAIDTGTDMAPLLPLTDFDGEPRLAGVQVDMGPDEFLFPALFPTYCDANSNSSGAQARICGVGDPSIAGNDLTVLLEGLPGTSGLLFYGPNQIQVSFGDGFRCVGGAIRRLPPMSGMGASISIDLNLANLQILPGVQANFQYWFRDQAAGGAGYNLSDGLEVNFVP